ncbi:uncharacterized protein LOC109706039 [Ananas comosus]|uniref:Uncharacterized protein LOC109706039 n=1 Tax=Ananas comosus TaxID=4615 RepID=A0A6P5EG58_ANACO|nr:uncharacterized protein LOC109706039 [Ananas comosus]
MPTFSLCINRLPLFLYGLSVPCIISCRSDDNLGFFDRHINLSNFFQRYNDHVSLHRHDFKVVQDEPNKLQIQRKYEKARRKLAQKINDEKAGKGKEISYSLPSAVGSRRAATTAAPFLVVIPMPASLCANDKARWGKKDWDERPSLKRLHSGPRPPRQPWTAREY